VENIVLISGRISIKEEEQAKIICEEVRPLRKQKVQKLYLKTDGRSGEVLSSVLSMLRFFQGNTPVCLCEEDKKVRVAEREYWVNLNEALLEELKQRLGEENVKVV
jgi:DNA polymerase III subunit alpha